MALDFVASCIGGFAGVIVGHPFDTVKVHLQTQDFKKPIYKGTWHCFTTIVKKDKISGLYKGVTSPLEGVSLVNAMVFGTCAQIERQIGSEGFYSHFLAGAAAGLLQSFVCSPLELAKTILQVQKRKYYSGTIDCLTRIYKKNGIRAVYKGFYVTVCRDIPSYGAYFMFFELLSGGWNAPTWRTLLAGGTAGSMSWIIIYPLDIIKTRIQSDGINCCPKYKSYLHCLRQGLKEEGYPFLTRGLVPTLLRAFPTNAVTFTVVVWVMRLSDYLVSKVGIASVFACVHTCMC